MTLEEILKLDLNDLASKTHIIIGPNGQCLCGNYNYQTWTCLDLLARKSEDMRDASIALALSGFKLSK